MDSPQPGKNNKDPTDCTNVFGGSDSSSEEEDNGDYDNLGEVSLEERSGNYRGSDDEPAE